MRESTLGASEPPPNVPIDSLQRSNHRPSPAQRVHLAAALTQKEASITNLEEDELDLQLKINHLMKEMRTISDIRSREQDEADSFRFLLAPIRLLAPELLAQIFKYALPAKPHPQRVSSPLGLAHVCSAWRKTIMGSSAFWNNLSIQVDIHAKSHRDPDIISFWYGHANSNAPLSLSLSTPTYMNYLPKSMYSSMVNFSYRITELRIYGDYDLHSQFLHLPGRTLPVLETLFLVGLLIGEDEDDYYYGSEHGRLFKSRGFKFDITPSEITVFDNFPRLRFVTLGLPSIAFRENSFFALSWSSITRLDIQGKITQGAFIRLTNLCPQLHAASFVVDTESSSHSTEVFNLATFVDLMSFRLQLCKPDNRFTAVDALPLMPLPKLLTLVLVDDEDHAFIFPLRAIFPGILDSLALVRCLQLSHISCSHDELLQLVMACPMLEDLRMHVLDKDLAYQLRCLRKTPPERDGHAPPLFAHLVSFTFAFTPDGRNSIEAVGAAFTELVYTWAMDPRRCRPLEYLSLYVWIEKYWFDKEEVAARQALERLQGEICDAVEQAQSSRPVVNVDVVSSLSELESLTGTFWCPF
ncbi:hypothetical protein D9615_009338 [Tricholomella constricta]|uniref:F-box domain-containing protein n=1 Tax=Tricholomella constricta TaxID=117010 RepID=A0A8H5H311_9AGAR|nr:hypothetical protein D9615_009338 [Tricholomella constricta]